MGRMERGATLPDPQNFHFVWPVRKKYSTRFYRAIRYYNNDSLVTVRQYDTVSAGIAEDETKIRPARFKLGLGS